MHRQNLFHLELSLEAATKRGFCKKGDLRNFAKFTGKQLCQSPFFNKVAGQACHFIKKETLVQVFSCEFCEVSKNTFSYRTPPLTASAWRGSVKKVILEISQNSEEILFVNKSLQIYLKRDSGIGVFL